MRRILIYILTGGFILSFKSCLFAQNKVAGPGSDSTATSVYGIELKNLDGTGTIDMASFKGKKILIVNTASECGYTYQYEGLQKLQDSFEDKLVVIGCPCNQFGGQEPGDSSEIRQFCTGKFAVTFPLSEKLDVKGDGQHPLYAWLTQSSKNGVLDAQVLWNFNKFLIDENGKLMAYFTSKTKPEDPALLELIGK